ncbi:MAG: glycosyltransferase family 4 protein [Proteobacteria bacterium]|nr:glycosyltransferase family 4 protein [Pseudomonadota bacterium]
MRLMIDGRMESDRFGPGDGVYTYYRMLRRIGSTFPKFAVLNDRLALGIERERPWTRAARLIRASSADSVTVDPEHPPLDIYRFAHVRFRMTRQLTRLDLAGPPGVMHWTYPLPLWIGGWRNIYTIHDALQLGPGGLQGKARTRQVALLQAIEARAHRLVTVSDFSRHELAGHLGWPADRIVNASIATLPPIVAPEPGNRRHGPILVLGTNGARKNIGFLLDAYIRSGISRPIMIVGPVNAYVDGLIRQYGTRPGITFTGSLTEMEISALLGRARCLAFPSLAEGFGLPIVEAMAHGCPVICANTGAMHEVAGGAAIGFTLGNSAELVTALQRIDGDDQLFAEYQQAGTYRTREFDDLRMRERLSLLYQT